jgi:prolipoprotein diacylglyceryltransferase
MFPHPLPLGGLTLEVWDLAFLVAVAAGYPVLSRSLRVATPAARPRGLPLRWLALVYLAAVSAQLFAYLVDAHTTVLPPPAVSPLRYYLDPFVGPKTLYGVILSLPLTAAVLCPPWRPRAYARALDAVTPSLCAVLAICRVGCFLQGCCYGVPSRVFGVAFPPGSPAAARQLGEGLLLAGSGPSALARNDPLPLTRSGPRDDHDCGGDR